MTLISVGIVGLGRVGMGFDLERHRMNPSSHIGAFSQNRHCHVTAVCDTQAERLTIAQRRFGRTIRTATRLDAMLVQEDFDVISVATPTPTHASIVEAILRSEKPPKLIFCEKPLTDNLNDAKKLIDLCQEKNVLLMVNHTRRFDEIWRWVYEQLLKEKFGKLISLYGVHPSPLLRSGIHLLDLVNWYVGRPDYVNFVGSNNNWVMRQYPESNDLSGTGMLTWENEDFVGLINCGAQPNYLLFEFDMLFEDGRISVTKNGVEVALFRQDKSWRYKGINELYERKGKRRPFNRTMPTPMESVVTNIVDVIQNHAHPLCGGMDGYTAIELIVAAHLSMKITSWVKLPLREEMMIDGVSALDYVIRSH